MLTELCNSMCSSAFGRGCALAGKDFLRGSTQSVNGFNQSAHSLKLRTMCLRVNFWIQNLFLSSAEHTGTMGGSKHKVFFFLFFFLIGTMLLELMKGDRRFWPLWNNCGGYDDYASDFVCCRPWAKSLRGHMLSQGQSTCFFFFFYTHLSVRKRKIPRYIVGIH